MAVNSAPPSPGMTMTGGRPRAAVAPPTPMLSSPITELQTSPTAISRHDVLRIKASNHLVCDAPHQASTIRETQASTGRSSPVVGEVDRPGPRAYRYTAATTARPRPARL